MNNTATYSNLPETQGQAVYSNTYSNYPSFQQTSRTPGPGKMFLAFIVF